MTTPPRHSKLGYRSVLCYEGSSCARSTCPPLGRWRRGSYGREDGSAPGCSTSIQVQRLINFMLSPRKQGATPPRRKCNPAANSGVPPSMSPASADIHWFSSTFANVFMLFGDFSGAAARRKQRCPPLSRDVPWSQTGVPTLKKCPPQSLLVFGPVL